MSRCVLVLFLVACSVDPVAMPFGTHADAGVDVVPGAGGAPGGAPGTGGIIGTGGSGGAGGAPNTCGPDGSRCGPPETCTPPNVLSGFGGVYPTIAVHHLCQAGVCVTSTTDCSRQLCTTCADSTPTACFTYDDTGAETGVAACRCVHRSTGAFCPLTASAKTVMALGDSITEGAGARVQGGYRGPFFAAHPGFTSVGSIASPQGWHEWHPSFTSQMILDNIAVWYAANPADIVLLHIGTNDYSIPAADTAVHVVAIVAAIHNINPAARVLVAQIINSASIRVTYNASYDAQRPLVEAALETLPLTQSVPFRHIDDAHLPDQVHPDVVGSTQMAEDWGAAL